MSSKGGKKPVIVPKVDPSKLEKIKQGIKTKTESGVKSNQNVTVNSRGDKIIAVQKEKKVEESGVTRKKRNFVMYESKTGTQKETDLQKIKGQKLRAPKPRVQETIILKRKKKEYLDNYQYHETKVFRKGKPAVVIHERLSSPIGGSFEEVTYQKATYRSSGSPGKNSRPTSRDSSRTEARQYRVTNVRNKASSPQPNTRATNVRNRPNSPQPNVRTTNVRNSPQPNVRTTNLRNSPPPRTRVINASKSPQPRTKATNVKTETTRVGRRNESTTGETKTTKTTTTTTRTTTTKGGERTTKTQTRTTTTRGKK
jgi:hypothetical protein